jgi:hypothetical protein
MKFETSISNEDDKFEAQENNSDIFVSEQQDQRKKRNHAAEIRRRIEKKMEEKWLRDELADFDTY